MRQIGDLQIVYAFDKINNNNMESSIKEEIKKGFTFPKEKHVGRGVVADDAEAAWGIKVLSPRQKELLIEEGYSIFHDLRGLSILDQARGVHRFYSVLRWNPEDRYIGATVDHRIILDDPSIRAEVAINPHKPLKISAGSPENLVRKSLGKLSDKVPGVKAIIGRAADYVEIIASGCLDVPEGEFIVTRDSLLVNPGEQALGRKNSMVVVGTSAKGIIIQGYPFTPYSNGVPSNGMRGGNYGGMTREEVPIKSLLVFPLVASKLAKL